mgnify:FL=1
MPSHRFPPRYPIALALCALTALAALPLRGWLDLANIVMLFLLVVFICAVRLGRGPAVAAAFASVALFDLLFVPPHLSFTVVDAQYLVTFTVMLAVGLIPSHLVARVGERTEAMQAREHETRTLYELARDLGAALNVEQAAMIVDRHCRGLGMTATLLIDVRPAGDGGDFACHGASLTEAERGQAGAAYRDDRPTRIEATGRAMMFLPFSGATRPRGVLVVAADHGQGRGLAPEPLLTAVASLAGIAVERLHYADVARQSELETQAEKLRSSLLSSISHDLRTPLTSLVGLADGLADLRPGLAPEVAETAAIMREQARAMHRMVTNLLDMARLSAGRIALNWQWQPFEEIVGSSVRLLDDVLANHALRVDLPPDLPLVRFDAVLMERVLCNLLENAAKYSDPGSAIDLIGRVDAGGLEISVRNQGRGFPPSRLDKVFELFERGGPEPAVAGAGVGLAVCRAIVAAHGGEIVAENRDGGARVRFTLPMGQPPALTGEPG